MSLTTPVDCAVVGVSEIFWERQQRIEDERRGVGEVRDLGRIFSVSNERSRAKLPFLTQCLCPSNKLSN